MVRTNSEDQRQIKDIWTKSVQTVKLLIVGRADQRIFGLKVQLKGYLDKRSVKLSVYQGIPSKTYSSLEQRIFKLIVGIKGWSQTCSVD